jgi:chemotaxis protein MotA
MGSIGGEASVIGHKVAAALVGTFVGILLAYGIFGPLAKAVEGQIHAEHQYLMSIKAAVLAFARGDSPLTCAEFARRTIDPDKRPTFVELEALTARK